MRRSTTLRTPAGRVRIPPSRHVHLDRTGLDWEVDITETRRRDCTKCPSRAECRCHVTKENYTTAVKDEDPRVAVIVAYLADLVHEALEWVTLDGQMYVNPHECAGNGIEIIEAALLDMVHKLKAVG